MFMRVSSGLFVILTVASWWMGEIFSCKVDTSGVMRMEKIVAAYSRWSPAQHLNRTVAFIVRDAQTPTPLPGISRIEIEPLI